MNNERPSFPDDALTADERKALRNERAMRDEQRKAWLRGQALGLHSDPYPAERHVAAVTQQHREQQSRRTWTNGFIWGAALCIIGLGGAGIIAFAAVGAW